MLTQQQITEYEERGYLVVPDVLGSAELDALRGQADAWVEASRELEAGDDLFDLEPSHTRKDPAIRRVKDPAATSPAFRSVVAHAHVVAALADLIGPDIRWQGSKLNMKSAGVGSPVEWHQDWAFYPHTNDDLLAVGVPLDDMTVENGALLAIPGSHRGPLLDHHASGVFAGAVDPRLVDASKIVALEAPAGAITVHHCRLLHGSAPNHSGRRRRLFLIEYSAADAWPLLGHVAGPSTWEQLEARIVAGHSTLSPRLEAVPVRIPQPLPGGSSGTIYEIQGTRGDRRFAFDGMLPGT
jgi:phytanoyl-CoA hydroxylase